MAVLGVDASPRAVAEWVFTNDGHVVLIEEGKAEERSVSELGELPIADFTIRKLALSPDRKGINRLLIRLARLKALHGLRELDLESFNQSAALSAEGIASLAGLGKLESLNLTGNRLGIGQLEALGNLQIRTLLLINTPATDSGLALLASSKRIEKLTCMERK